MVPWNTYSLWVKCEYWHEGESLQSLALDAQCHGLLLITSTLSKAKSCVLSIYSSKHVSTFGFERLALEWTLRREFLIRMKNSDVPFQPIHSLIKH